MTESLPSKLILIGGGTGNKYAPWDGERWGVNATCLGTRVHTSFHLHDLEHPEQYRITGTKDKQADFFPFLSFVKLTSHPVLSIREYPDLPSVKRFPYEEICDYFQTNYFSNSFCYMLAYAMYKGYPNIEMYGFNFLMAGEYDDELPAVHFWLGMAHSRGWVLGENIKIIGNYSKMLHCKDNNSNLPGVSYSYLEPLKYTPTQIPINIRPATKEEADGMCSDYSLQIGQ